jgi:hypothetical protein
MSGHVMFLARSPKEVRCAVGVRHLISDLREFASESEGVLDRFGRPVGEANSLLDDLGIEVREPESNTGGPAGAVYLDLGNLRPVQVESALEALEGWRNAPPGCELEFPNDAIAAVRDALPRVICPWSALSEGVTQLLADTSATNPADVPRCHVYDFGIERRAGVESELIVPLLLPRGGASGIRHKRRDTGRIEYVVSPGSASGAQGSRASLKKRIDQSPAILIVLAPAEAESADLEKSLGELFNAIRRKRGTAVQESRLSVVKDRATFMPRADQDAVLTTDLDSAGGENEPADSRTRMRELVRALERGDLEQEDRRRCILEAEALPFRGAGAAAIVPLLRQFVEEYHGSNDPDDLVAVGSAIRSYVSIATVDDAFEAATSLLKAEGRLSLPIDLELEIVKMVVRKLTANPPSERDSYQELAIRLEELVDDYASPRWLAREKCGAVLLNAILGLILSRSGPDAEVVETIRALGVPWFEQLVGRRAARLQDDLLDRHPEAKVADIIQTLDQLRVMRSTVVAS